MILGFIFKAFIWIASGLVSLLPVIDAQIPPEFVGMLSNVIASVHFFLPISFMVNIFVAYLAVRSSMLVWRIILRTKSFVPTWGN